MPDKPDVLYGSLGLIVLKTLVARFFAIQEDQS
jgi:hypothetical protein